MRSEHDDWTGNPDTDLALLKARARARTPYIPTIDRPSVDSDFLGMLAAVPIALLILVLVLKLGGY